MSQTKIEWADKVWNPVTGCSKISAGCQNCYAERMSKRLAGRCGYPKDNPFKVTLHPDKLDQPYKWKKPQRIFVNSMSDLFHPDVPFEFIGQVFARMHNHQKHTFMVLTKRPERMKEFIQWYKTEWLAGFESAWPREYQHVWLGVTAENQAAADERIPILLQTPRGLGFVSIEPMIGPVDLSKYVGQESDVFDLGGVTIQEIRPELDWVIVGGETGPKARPMHPEWVLSLRDQCHAANVPFFFKSWGEWSREPENTPKKPLEPHQVCWLNQDGVTSPVGQGTMPKGAILMPRVGKKKAGRNLDGRTWEEFPGNGGKGNE
jgi:protein gp37